VAAETEDQDAADDSAAATASAAETENLVEELKTADSTLLEMMTRILEATTPETVGMTAATYKELMDYLGRDKQMAQAQLLLLSDEAAVLRQERDSALQQVAAVRAEVIQLRKQLDELQSSEAQESQSEEDSRISLKNNRLISKGFQGSMTAPTDLRVAITEMYGTVFQVAAVEDKAVPVEVEVIICIKDNYGNMKKSVPHPVQIISAGKSGLWRFAKGLNSKIPEDSLPADLVAWSLPSKSGGIVIEMHLQMCG